MDAKRSESDDESLSLPDQFPIGDEGAIISENESILVIPQKGYGKRLKFKPRKQESYTKTIKVPRYFTAGANVTEENVRDITKEPSPFSFPQDMKEFAHKVMNKAWRNDERVNELQEKFWKQPGFKERQRRDLLNRLYVKDPSIDAVKTVLDIDPNYFHIIKGRPIPERLDLKKYIDTVRDSLRTKILIGYRKDDIVLIDEALEREQNIINNIKQNLQSYINTFEDFLLKDHLSAMSLLKDADEATRVTYDKYVEYKSVAQKFASLNCSLLTLDEKWSLCKTYQKFLYTVSPLQWRMEQTLQQQRASVYVLNQSSDELVFGSMRSSFVSKNVSVQDVMNQFNEEAANQIPPQLYFTKPEELMEVFKFMEMQNLNSLLHTEEIAQPLESVKDAMKVAVETFDQEIKNLQEMIWFLEGGISWEESHVKYLEELATNLLSNEFRNLIVEEKILNLHVIVEDIYETRIGPNDANASFFEMMKAVEGMYREELLFFDKIPRNEIVQLEGCYYQEETLLMKLAEKASKDFDELEKLTTSLKKAFNPYTTKPTRALKQRTVPANPPKKVQLPARSLTERERDYLEYFTQFCSETDSPIKFGIDISKDEDEQKLVIPKEAAQNKK